MTAAMIICVGSRGDIEPVLSLSAKLLNRFDTVHVVHQPEYAFLVPQNPRIVSHLLPFNTEDFWTVYKRHLIKAVLLSVFYGFDVVKVQIECLSKLMGTLVIPCAPMLLDLAEHVKPSIVLSTTLCMSVGMTVAEKRGIPFCLFNFQPNTPTTAYPSPMHSEETARTAAEEVARMHGQSPSEYTNNTEYLKSYGSQYDLSIPSLPQLNLIRKSRGIVDMREQDVRDILSGRHPMAHVIDSFCLPLVPESPDHGENVHRVPPLADGYLPVGWNPKKECPEIFEYLSTGEKPVCVTFGSMGSSMKSGAVTREIFNGLRAAGVTRVLVLNGTTDMGAHHLWRLRDGDLIEWAKKHVFVTKEKPQYAWLFPKCKSVVCHGGAGTTFAALRAGIPVAVSPVLCDQFFWGSLLDRMELGSVTAPKLQDATRDNFKVAVETSLELKVVERARRFGEDVRAGQDGSTVAAELITTLAQS